MQLLPNDILREIYSYLDKSTQCQFNCVFANLTVSKRCYTKTLGEQALEDGNYNIFLECKTLLYPRCYIAAVKGNLMEAVKYLKDHDVQQPQKLPFVCVKYNREDIYAIIKTRDTSKYVCKSVAYGCTWLKKTTIIKNMANKKLLKYAVRYGNLELVKRITQKDSDCIKFKHLYIAKVRGYTEILHLFFDKMNWIEHQYIYLLDDVDLFKKVYPNWRNEFFKEDYFTESWRYLSFELLRYFVKEMFFKLLERTYSIMPNFVLIGDPYYTEENTVTHYNLIYELRRIRYRLYIDICKEIAVNTCDYFLFFLADDEKTRATLTIMKKYLPSPYNQYSYSNYDKYYNVSSEYFTIEEHLNTFCLYGGISFVKYCETRNITLDNNMLYKVAIQTGDKEILQYIIAKGWIPSTKDFLYSLKNPNTKCTVKYIKNGAQIIRRQKRWSYSRELIEIVYQALTVPVEQEHIKELCSQSTLLYLYAKNIL